MTGGADAEGTVRGVRHWSLRDKLLTLLLLLGLTIFAVTGAIGYVSQLRSLQRNVVNHLTSIRTSKAYELEDYYRTVHNHVMTLSDDRMFIDAMREFRAAYRTLNAVPLTEQERQVVTDDYRLRFYPQMQALKIARGRFEDYLPITPAALHLQYAYRMRNPFPQNLRRFASAADGSDYSRVHAKYHPAFRKLIEAYGYYDLYLIDYETGDAVYDVNKDRDLGTSLKVGPYRTSNLAKVVEKCLATNDPDAVFFSDFEPYEANRGEPTQWVASPIFDAQERIGILALQISTAHIDDVASGRRGWLKDGLGRSGRTSIVGSDYRIRTNVRSFLEEPQAFLGQLRAEGVPEDTIARIRAHESTILELQIRRPSVTAALRGETGSTIEPSPFSSIPNLVSFMPLRIEGLHWALESRMDQSEAFRPVFQMERFFIWWGAVIFAVIVVAATLLTRWLLLPINALTSAASRVAAGDLTARADWSSGDELGMLCRTFNSMTASIREKTELIEQKNRENEALLLNILPGEIAQRLKSGESEIADDFVDVTVLFADLVGFTALSSHLSADQIVEMLNGLFSRFDEIAHELGIEKIKTIGDCYMAVCGLPERCPEHTERGARMALRMLEVTGEYGRQHQLPLQLRIGLNAGPVVAGVIGTSKFIYDLWGDTVNIASRMESTGVPGAIQVTRNVYDRLKDRFEFQARGMIQVKGKGELETWILVARCNNLLQIGSRDSGTASRLTESR